MTRFGKAFSFPLPVGVVGVRDPEIVCSVLVEDILPLPLTSTPENKTSTANDYFIPSVRANYFVEDGIRVGNEETLLAPVTNLEDCG